MPDIIYDVTVSAVWHHYQIIDSSDPSNNSGEWFIGSWMLENNFQAIEAGTTWIPEITTWTGGLPGGDAGTGTYTASLAKDGVVTISLSDASSTYLTSCTATETINLNSGSETYTQEDVYLNGETTTIIDNETLPINLREVGTVTSPTISIAGASTVYENSSGAAEAAFTVTLSAASQDILTVKYVTQDGSAHAGTDYEAENGTLTFAPGQTTAKISVPIIGTELAQHNETFSVVLSNPTDSGGGTPTISGSPATGTIDALFTDGAEVVNFNNLSPEQQAAIAAGAETTDGYGGDDVVTLPSSGDATFTTGSKAGDDYTVNGGDGSYTIVEGAGTETVTINGDGSSTITAGSGADTIAITGNGDNTVNGGSGADTVTFSGTGDNTFNGVGGNYNVTLGSGSDTVTINGDGSSTIAAGSGADTISITGTGANNVTIGYGTDNVRINGTGANTISAGTSSAGITITNFSGRLTGSAPSPSPGTTVTLTGADSGNATIGSNSTLELAAGSSLNGTIAFGATAGVTNAVLKIDQPQDFNISINGLQIGDTIDVADPILTEAIDGNELILDDTAGDNFTYQIAGKLAGNGFLISSDGSGGSNLTLEAPPALDNQSSELAGKVIDAVQAGRDAFLKGTALALDTGNSTSLLEATGTLANACAAVGVGVNFTVAGATLKGSLSQATSAQARYDAVEAFDVDITNTLAKAVFVYMAGASPAIEVAFLSGLLGSAVAVGTGPLVVTALLGVALGYEAGLAYDQWLKPTVTSLEKQNFESAHPPPVHQVLDGYLSGQSGEGSS